MKRIIPAVKYDILFQVRHGFYHLYTIISLSYVGFLLFLPEELRTRAVSLIVFSDPGVLGFFFIGGIILLERSQKIFDSLFVTPFHVFEYLVSKIISLTILALLASVVITFSVFGIDLNWPLLFWGISLSSVFFTLIGIILAVRSRSINEYILLSPLYITVFSLPIFEYVNLFYLPVFEILPSKAALVLIEASFGSISLANFLMATGVLIVWIILAYLAAYRSFMAKVVFRIGAE